MKTVFKVLGGIVIVIVAIVVLAFVLTNGVADSADKFFSLIKENKTKEAYDSTAKEFQAATTYDQFTAFLSGSSMNKYVSGTWTSRSVENNQGTLQGSINTSDKGVIPIEIKVVNEDGKWKILNMRPVSGGLQPTTSTTATPSASPTTKTALAFPTDAEVTQLTGTSMSDFGAAVNAGDFTAFYNSIAELWKSQTTPEELKKVFQPFIDKKVDLSFVATATPVFSQKPALDEQNVLVTTGYYPTKDFNVNFELKYVYEYPAWKLVGIDVNVK